MRRMTLSAPPCAMALALSLVPVQADDTDRSTVQRNLAGLMGTSLAIEVEAPTREAALLASEAAVRAIQEVEARLSTWGDDSELARLNSAPVGRKTELSPELADDLARARVWWKAIGGAFDPGVGGIADAWGLRDGGREPAEAELESAVAVGGFAALELDGRTAVRKHADLRLEEGGFGKGVGLDAAVAALRAAGIERASLDLGGQVAVLDDTLAPEPVTYAIAHPRDRARAVVEFALARGSFATTGTSERGAHVFDPRTGRPVADFGSVTVWAAEATTADCLSTALFVLGADAALAWAEARPGIEALVLEPRGDAVLGRATSGLRGMLAPIQDRAELSFLAPAAVAAADPREAGADAPTTPAQGDDDDLESRVEKLEEENAEMREQLEIFGQEFERFTLGDIVPPIGDSFSGLGPSASKVYSKDQGLSIGGYGEALYQSFAGNSMTDEIDFLRAVLYFGFKYDENWVLNTEFEFEHAGTGGGGSVSVEFATIDYLGWGEEVNARGGLLLIPMGFLNEMHEPTTFLSATRPMTESVIIPSTWRENGAGVFGDVGGFAYRAYLVNGLDSSGFKATGLRGGRQKGSEALADDFALVVRADYVDTPGVIVGGSVYHGDSDQDQAGFGDNATTIYELHGEYKSGGLWLRALAAMAEIDDVEKLNAALGLTGAASVGEELEGYYAEAGYDVMTWLDPESEVTVSPFVRWEHVDTQAEVPTGFLSDPANDEEILTFGVASQPIPQIIFKIEYQDRDQGVDSLNAGMGFVF